MTTAKPARCSKATDIRVVGARVFFLPVVTRVPLKFGSQTLTSVTCARVEVTVEDRLGRSATGWGETPLSVEWVWPSPVPYARRQRALQRCCEQLADRWASFSDSGHPLELGASFIRDELPATAVQSDDEGEAPLRLPLLATLACCSPFDIALYDAFGNLHGLPALETLTKEFLNQDLAHHLEPDADDVRFEGTYPADYLASRRANRLTAWHLVGGLDPIEASELRGDEPRDGHPVLLADWIQRDGLRCLKIKLTGVDAGRDFQRLARVGLLGTTLGVEHLCADFNCMVTDPSYVLDVLDRLAIEEPEVRKRLLYVEQPFPHDIAKDLINVRTVSERTRLLLDESAHDWQHVRLGRALGWTGVALKTCKTLSGALLSLAWARAHGMHLMVQDLTNPMLAQIAHVGLAAHADTMMGVETNSMQFYPDASEPEARVHPGVYRRRDGEIDLSTIRGPGLGYRIDEVARELPPPAAARGTIVSDATRVARAS